VPGAPARPHEGGFLGAPAESAARGDEAVVVARIAARVAAGGVCIQDDFLGEPQRCELFACAQLRHRRGEFMQARVGGAERARRSDDIRGDATCWLSAPHFSAELRLLDSMESLRLAFNREATLGLFDLELHYARYDPGAFFARHVDQPQGSEQRQVSLALYLNAAWQPANGGALRVYAAGGECRDIAPLGGRLVVFRTPGLEHAVLPAACTRWSISGWFRRRA
jgi:SM-20-related protein